MPKPWQNINLSQLSLLCSMVFYVHSVILICQHFSLSYNLTLFVSYTSMPCCFFLICKFLTMEESFGSLFWNHTLFVSAHLPSVCDHHNQDLWLAKFLFSIGILLLSLHTIYIWCYPQQTSDSAEKNRVHVTIIEILFSAMANGMALVGRWFVPRDNLSGLTFEAGAMFSVGVAFFCCYLFFSRKFKKP